MSPLVKEPTIVLRLGLALGDGWARSYGLGRENPLDHLITAAVRLGTLEGRPMTAYKLAAFLDLPRATVVRRLKVLARKRVITPRRNGAYVVSPTFAQTRTSKMQRAIKLILRAAEELRELGHGKAA
jgi:predicted transcriptional regulator